MRQRLFSTLLCTVALSLATAACGEGESDRAQPDPVVAAIVATSDTVALGVEGMT